MNSKKKTKKEVEGELLTAINGVLISHKISEKKLYNKSIRPFTKDLAKKMAKLIVEHNNVKKDSRKRKLKGAGKGRPKKKVNEN